MTRVCHECGEGTVVPHNVRGTLMAYKDEKRVSVNTDVLVPTCNHCGEQYATMEIAEELDVALETSWRAMRLEQQQGEVRQLVDDLGFTQSEIEHLFELSPGYLSKMMHGKPSSALIVRFLHVLRRSPHETVRAIGEIAPHAVNEHILELTR